MYINTYKLIMIKNETKRRAEIKYAFLECPGGMKDNGS